MRIAIVGDSYCPASALSPAFDVPRTTHEIYASDVADDPTWRPTSPSELRLREYLGSPAQVMDRLDQADVLIVQGAPVTDAVLDAAPRLRLLGVARGGPVNVDLDAATARGIPVVTTPGKNAAAVAELTMAFLVALARRLPEAMRYVDSGSTFGHDNYEGARWFGRELGGATIGLIGCGQVGRRVVGLARAFGMRVLVHDPFVPPADISALDAAPVSLNEALERSDFISLHARATTDNAGLIDREAIGRMRRGAMLINTARETLVDEEAVADALATGHLAGAAFDVVRPPVSGGRHPLLAHPNVIIVAHIGGATHETLARGGHMIAAEVARLERGEPLVNLVNRAGLEGIGATATTRS